LELLRINPAIKLIHHYGPTETTVGVTSFTDFNNNIFLDAIDSVPLGKAAINTKAYVLNSNNTPTPIGVIGELHIGGAGVARGYLNLPGPTSERFVPNIFATEADKEKGYHRLYKTGDLVRWLADGNLEFIGRNDDQVKIRGYRIELGEIEHALSKIPGIKQSCVLAKERKTEGGVSKYLVGYYVPDDSTIGALTQASAMENLCRSLPEYMVPAVLVEMSSFPLTINGKLDKRSLPNPDFTSSQEYILPVTDAEITACKIWQEVLGLERVGLTDDFFKIGGNSILAIQVSHRMSKELGCNFKVADVFKQKNITTLLNNISSRKTDSDNVEWEA
jgi:acyl-coenzyme A synthetase/AMP-(fatty) acid ligase